MLTRLTKHPAGKAAETLLNSLLKLLLFVSPVPASGAAAQA